MSLLRTMSYLALAAGFCIVAVGGMSVKSDPDGTWVKLNLVHVAGAVVFLVGVLLAVFVMFLGSRARTG